MVSFRMLCLFLRRLAKDMDVKVYFFDKAFPITPGIHELDVEQFEPVYAIFYMLLWFEDFQISSSKSSVSA